MDRDPLFDADAAPTWSRRSISVARSPRRPRRTAPGRSGSAPRMGAPATVTGSPVAGSAHGSSHRPPDRPTASTRLAWPRGPARPGRSRRRSGSGCPACASSGAVAPAAARRPSSGSGAPSRADRRRRPKRQPAAQRRADDQRAARHRHGPRGPDRAGRRPPAVDIPIVLPTGPRARIAATAWIIDGRLSFVWPRRPRPPDDP